MNHDNKIFLRALPRLLPATLALGVSCQVIQILFLRELLTVFHGNELSIGIIMACWMVWVGVGSGLGALSVGLLGRPRLQLCFTAMLLPMVLLGTVFTIRLTRGFFDVLPGVYLAFGDTILSCFLLMAPTCMLLGAQFILLARLWREHSRRLDTWGASNTYVFEATGNIAGGLLFTFVLARHFNSFQAAIIACMLMPAALLTLRDNVSKRAWSERVMPACFLLLMFAAYPFLTHLDSYAYTRQWQIAAPGQQLIETRPSRYGTIAVTRRADQYSFFQSGHLLFSTAAAEATASAFEEQEATQFAHFAMAQHPAPESVLLIGGGLRGTLREILRHPVTHVDYVELDKVLTETASAYLSESVLASLTDERVRMMHTDGRLFVRTANRQYDMIIVDAPDPATAALNRYYTADFFREVYDRLLPGGVFVIGVDSVADLRGAAVANRNATIYHTLRSVFPYVLPAGERFLYLFASNTADQITADPMALRDRFLEREITVKGFRAGHYGVLMQEEPLRRINWILRNHGRRPDAHLAAPETGPLFPGSIAEQEAEEADLPPVRQRYFINNDFRPIGYYYTLVYWNVLTRAGRDTTLAWIIRVNPYWIIPIGASVLLLGLCLRILGQYTGWRVDTRYAVLLAVFTTGLSTMALQIALLFAFQSVYGFIYEMVGLIVAAFMCGLAGGAALAHVYIKDKSNTTTLASMQLLIALFAGLIGILLPLSASIGSPTVVFVLFLTITFVAGLLNGVDFPLTTACCMSLNQRTERSAALVYGLELMGACCGAILAGVVVAPVLGIVACCLLAGVINALAFMVIMISRSIHA